MSSIIRPTARNFFTQQRLRPGRSDAPDFQRLEQRDPSVLEDYAAFVKERPQAPEEEADARTVIEKALQRLVDHVPHAQRQRRCGDVGQLLIRVLEQQGVW